MESYSLTKTVQEELFQYGSFIYGTGSFALHLQECLAQANINFLGFLDYRNGNSKNIEFQTPRANGDRSLVILGFNNYLADINLITLQLEQNNYTVINLIEFVRLLKSFSIPMENYWLTNRFEIYDDNRVSINSAHEIYQDAISRKISMDLIEFRKTGSINYLSHKSSLETQYFPIDFPWIRSLYSRGNDIVGIDGGAFQGESAVQASNIINIAKWVMVEPDANNHVQLMQNINGLDGEYVLVAKALSNKNGNSKFNMSENSHASSIDENGNLEIETITIDQIASELNRKVDFIKLDVEGSELKTIIGAEYVISKHRPHLAISIYHKPEDHWEIPLFMKANFPNYSFYLRFHGEQSFDSILYCMPNNHE